MTPVNVSLEPVAVPPPVDVLLEFINASAVRISWSYPDKEQPNSVHFLVRYSHDGDPYINAASEPTRESSFVFSGMLYGGYYQFQVVAIQGQATSEPATTDYFINGITGLGISCGLVCASLSMWGGVLSTLHVSHTHTCSSEK